MWCVAARFAADISPESRARSFKARGGGLGGQAHIGAGGAQPVPLAVSRARRALLPRDPSPFLQIRRLLLRPDMGWEGGRAAQCRYVLSKVSAGEAVVCACD
jgi:hypothetical protein